jgi:NHL repeat
MTKLTVFTLALLSTSSLLNAQWTNGQDAEYVVGHITFTDQSFSNTTKDGFYGVFGCDVDVINDKLYVSDYANHRVLRFDYPITEDGPSPDLVFGQSSFTTGVENNDGISASSLNYPYHVTVDSNGELYVSDYANNRILIYNNASSLSSNKPSANKVIGQPNFTSSTGTSTQTTMTQPVGTFVDNNDTLWVCDRGNHRVLRYDNISSKSSGAAADGVLGQTNFTNASSGLSDSKFYRPEDIVMVGTSLFVADGDNNRVLRFDHAALKADGASADGVLGQGDFISNSTTVSQSLLGGQACTVEADGYGTLYVGTEGRILIYNNATSLADGAPANNVLGQIGFTSNTATCTQAGLSDSVRDINVDLDNDKLIIADTYHHRVLIQSASGSLPVELDYFLID